MPYRRPDSVSQRRRHRAQHQNDYLEQQMKATPVIPHKLAQQQRQARCCSLTHEEVVRLLEQTHSEELMAAKAGHEKESNEATSAVKEEECDKLKSEVEVETQKYVTAMQDSDGFLRAGRHLQGRHDRLKTKADDLARGLNFKGR
ncbi:unnamed protein product [Penicillium discolor]